MLVLGRHVGESLVINGNIVVTVNRINGDKVRLSIEAPRDVKILRKELIERDELLTSRQQLTLGKDSDASN